MYLACEGEATDFVCSDGTLINIISASYGIRLPAVCMETESPSEDETCVIDGEDITSRVKQAYACHSLTSAADIPVSDRNGSRFIFCQVVRDSRGVKFKLTMKLSTSNVIVGTPIRARLSSATNVSTVSPLSLTQSAIVCDFSLLLTRLNFLVLGFTLPLFVYFLPAKLSSRKPQFLVSHSSKLDVSFCRPSL